MNKQTTWDEAHTWQLSWRRPKRFILNFSPCSPTPWWMLANDSIQEGLKSPEPPDFTPLTFLCIIQLFCTNYTMWTGHYANSSATRGILPTWLYTLQVVGLTDPTNQVHGLSVLTLLHIAWHCGSISQVLICFHHWVQQLVPDVYIIHCFTGVGSPS